MREPHSGVSTTSDYGHQQHEGDDDAEWADDEREHPLEERGRWDPDVHVEVPDQHSCEPRVNHGHSDLLGATSLVAQVDCQGSVARLAVNRPYDHRLAVRTHVIGQGEVPELP